MIGILITIVIFGVVLWAVNYLIPMEPKIKTVLNVVALVFVLLYVLQAFGLWHAPALR